MNLTSPKSIVFLTALFPQFIMSQQSQLMQYIAPGATTIAVNIIVMVGCAALTRWIAPWIREPKQMKALNETSDLLSMLVGVLLVSARHT